MHHAAERLRLLAAPRVATAPDGLKEALQAAAQAEPETTARVDALREVWETYAPEAWQGPDCPHFLYREDRRAYSFAAGESIEPMQMWSLLSRRTVVERMMPLLTEFLHRFIVLRDMGWGKLARKPPPLRVLWSEEWDQRVDSRFPFALVSMWLRLLDGTRDECLRAGNTEAVAALAPFVQEGSQKIKKLIAQVDPYTVAALHQAAGLLEATAQLGVRYGDAAKKDSVKWQERAHLAEERNPFDPLVDLRTHTNLVFVGIDDEGACHMRLPALGAP